MGNQLSLEELREMTADIRAYKPGVDKIKLKADEPKNKLKMRKLEVTLTYKYEIEVNDNDDIVKEYKDDNELINDLASYRFSPVLPVVAVGAIKITDTEVLEIVSIKSI